MPELPVTRHTVDQVSEIHETVTFEYAVRLPARSVAESFELGEGDGVDAGGHRILLSHLRGFVEARLLVVHPHLAREAVGTHAVHPEAERGVLDGGVAGNHEGFHLALARVVSQLLENAFFAPSNTMTAL